MGHSISIPAALSSMKIADPDGDVILVIGEKSPVSICASSKVLGLASPVFKAMFSPNFWEGTNLSSSNPRRISLPEDDPTAVEYLCFVLHFRCQDDKTISREEFEEVAVLCEKYDCIHAVSYWSKSWLNHFALEQFHLDPKEHYRRMLGQICTSYLYDNHEAFWESSKHLLMAGLPNDDAFVREVNRDLKPIKEHMTDWVESK